MNDTLSSPIAQAFWQACVLELEALKPGNVSVYSEGHGMQVSDFLRSAESCADIMAQPGLSIGARILRSIQATRQAVNCNTNLGIVLLCAPLAQAMLGTTPESAQTASDLRQQTLRQAVQQVLQQLSQADAEQVFRAIRLAEPGGLGQSDQHDVHQPARASLLDIMTAAEQRDRIAYQYSHGLQDIFETGLPVLQQELQNRASLQWSVVGIYLNFLASFPDSHIMRKQGAEIAAQVRQQAQDMLYLYNKQVSSTELLEPLLAFDQDLKRQGINPGTSADLTVATLFAEQLQELCINDFSASPLRAAFVTRQHIGANASMLPLVF
ncbi:MAG: triphosphoribosyl-dephospho-CoA synthase [Gammaproteobacteria bacterium]